uniref:Teleost multiple tissue opsin 3b n=1 Tax=Sphaeramia orbicularis TaxID=375764 RepID=A0A672ZT17_9TELE
MLVCIFGTPFSFAASVRGSWLTGTSGCRWYGFSNALFGIVSLVSLSLLSFERYSALLRSSQSDPCQYRRAWLAVATSWLYSLAWTVPPLLGWSSYGLEGPGTTCSVQWAQRSPAARSYVSCLFFFCLLLPLLLMFFCYGRILLAVRGVTRQTSAEQREGRVLMMVVSMVSGYLLCWMPYGIVAMLSSLGQPGVVSPIASLIPSLLAKTSTVLNPVIYVLLNNQARGVVFGSVCLFVCLFVNTLAVKLLVEFMPNWVYRLPLTQNRPDYILGKVGQSSNIFYAFFKSFFFSPFTCKG